LRWNPSGSLAWNVETAVSISVSPRRWQQLDVTINCNVVDYHDDLLVHFTLDS